MKLALMFMGGSALVFVGLIGLYLNTNAGNGQHTFDILQIAQMNIPLSAQKFFFPFAFVGFGIFGALFPFHTWVPDGHSSAPTAASMFLAGISMKLGGYGCLRVATFLMPEAAHQYSLDHHCTCIYRYYIWGLRYHDADRSEIYQCIFLGKSLRICIAGHRNADKNSDHTAL